jgi:hypothetical protein
MSDGNNIETENQAIDLLTSVKETRVNFLTGLNDLLMFRNTLLEDEVTRIRNLSNGPDPDSRIQMLEENIKAAKPVVNAISIQIEIGQISVPSLKQGEVIVHGRITDPNGHGIKNLVVSLVVEGKALDIKSKSDASGYDSLVLPATIVDNIKQHADMLVYINRGTVLVYKAADPIKITDEQQIKFEVVLTEDDIKRTTQVPEKCKKLRDKVKRK